MAKRCEIVLFLDVIFGRGDTSGEILETGVSLKEKKKNIFWWVEIVECGWDDMWCYCSAGTRGTISVTIMSHWISSCQRSPESWLVSG